MMRIVLLEDDDLQAGEIEDALKRVAPSVVVEWIYSESAFRTQLNEIKKHPPQGFIIDLLVLWAEPGEEPETPKDLDIDKEGHYRAGLRCIELIRREASLRTVPVILFTVIGREDIGHTLDSLDVQYRQKDQGTETFAKWAIGLFRGKKS